jgi:D-xylose transport system substrate-binding protein
MKRLLGTMLFVLLILSACQSGDNTMPRGGNAKIALLLPESKTTRYESHDRPLFQQKLEALCPDCEIIYSNADQDAAKQHAQAEGALANGARVLVLDAVDGAAARSIAEQAKAQKVRVIAYDRMIPNTDAIDAYISFDNMKVGRIQGQALLEALASKANPQVVMINGSPTDNNATLNKAGAHSVLDGKVTIAKEYDTPDWSPDKAQDEMTQALTALANRVDGVRAANDGTAGGAIAAMKRAGVTPLPPVTGQDAELAAIQRILVGEQYMTVYKAIRPQAETAAEIAVQLLTDPAVPAHLTNGRTVNNGKKDIPAVLLEPISVTRANLKETVIKDGFWSIEQICTTAYEKACKAAKIY